MGRAIVSALRMLLVLTVVVGVLYPLAIWGVGRVVFSDQADGSLVTRDGEVVGSSLIGQAFEGPAWFVGTTRRLRPCRERPVEPRPDEPGARCRGVRATRRDPSPPTEPPRCRSMR